MARSEVASGSPFRPAAEGVRVAVRLTPRARRTDVGGLAPAPDGRTLLRAAVTAPPEDGRANDALLRLLAREWRLARSRLSIVTGAGDRTKVVAVSGDPAELLPRLEGWLAGLTGD